jgi:uncharacterized protein (DUF302 family)
MPRIRGIFSRPPDCRCLLRPEGGTTILKNERDDHGGTRMTTTSTGETTFTVRRLSVAVPDVRGFQRSYEAAIPEVPWEQVNALVQRGAPWSEMVELIASSAPHGFLIYARLDLQPLMGAAGDGADCVAYLMGNHVTAERMFRHDPRAMLYVPLRTVIWEDSTGDAWFTVDQPSTQLGSLGLPEVSNVGVELDRKLAALLEALDVDVPEALLQN